MRMRTILSSVAAALVAKTSQVSDNLQPIYSADGAVPKRPGHRQKAPQRKKHHPDGRFRTMMRLHATARLPKGIDAEGFDGFVNVGGVVYLTKHGTHYRLDRLVKCGRVQFSAA